MKEEEYGNLLSPAQVRQLLEQELVEREELNYEQKLTVSHIDRIKKIPLEVAEPLVEALLKLERVTPSLAFKMMEIIPKDGDDLEVVFQRERFNLSDEEKQQILDLFAQYL